MANLLLRNGTSTLEVISPVDGNTTFYRAYVYLMPILHDAVEAAQTAFHTWSKTPIKERVQVFFRYKTLLEKNLKELAELMQRRKWQNLWRICC